MKRYKYGIAIAAVLVAAMLLMFAFTACDFWSNSNQGENIKYTATFVADGDTIDEVEFTVEDKALTEPAVPDKAGYTGVWEEYDIIASDITIEALYTPIVYNIEYNNLVDGTHFNTTEYTIESDTIDLQAASRAGYDFDGWYDGEQEVTEIATGSHGDKTLTAKWETIEYTITYDGLGGGTHSNTTEYTIESDTIVLQDASRAGYDFVGWYDNEQKVTEIAKGSHEDITLTAYWEIVDCSVEYILNGGVNAESNPSSYTILTLGGADGRIELADPVKIEEATDYKYIGDGVFEGKQNVYTFLGWYKDPSFAQKVDSLTLDLGDVTLYAKWGEAVPQTKTEQVYTREGDYIYFGEYPQTIKADNVTVGDVADEDGYYLGSDGERYAKMVADPYSSSFIFSDGSKMIGGETYYFKVEPIRWRILSENENGAFILADSIIENRVYDAGGSNNYMNSDIRAWLNEDFLDIAFEDLAQSLIKTTTVNNSAYSTGYDGNIYACANTSDRVFLLSYREALNSSYGFSSKYTSDDARQMTESDYALINKSSSMTLHEWILRSPAMFNDRSDLVRFIMKGGSIPNGGCNVSSPLGVVPAMNIKL